MIVVNVRNSGGNFSSCNSSSVLEHVLSNFMVKTSWSFVSKEVVVHGISSSDDFDVIKVVRPNSWETGSTIVHLSCEDLISEEVVSEESGIGVSEVVGVSSGDIWQVTEEGVH